MSYNTTVNIIDLENGRVSGKTVRMKGTTGKLLATPDRFYEFVEWQNLDGTTHSTSNPLTISSWSDMTLKPVFQEIILTQQYFEDRDMMETATWVLQNGIDSVDPSSHGEAYQSTTKYRFEPGVWSGPQFRVSTSGVSVSAYPCEHGLNYGSSTINGSVKTYVRGAAEWFDTTSTANSAFSGYWGYHHGGRPWNSTVFPTSGVSASRFAKANRSGTHYIYGGPLAHPNVGGFWGWKPDNSYIYHYSSYSSPSVGIKNSPSIGPASPYPGWELIDVRNFDMYYAADHIDFRDMKHQGDSIRWWGRHSHHSSMDPYSRTVYCTDGIAWWKNLRAIFFHDNSPWGHLDYANYPELSGFKWTPRQLEFLNYTPDMTHWQAESQYAFADLSGKDVPNPHWHADYQNVPNNGSCLTMMAGSNLENIQLRANANIGDFSFAFRNRFTNLKALSVYRSVYNYSPTYMRTAYHVPINTSDWDWSGLRNLQSLYLEVPSGYATLSSVEWVNTIPSNNLKDFTIYGLHENTDLRPIKPFIDRQTNLRKLRLSTPGSNAVGAWRNGEDMTEYQDEPIKCHVYASSTEVSDHSRFSSNVTLHNVTITAV